MGSRCTWYGIGAVSNESKTFTAVKLSSVKGNIGLPVVMSLFLLDVVGMLNVHRGHVFVHVVSDLGHLILGGVSLIDGLIPLCLDLIVKPGELSKTAVQLLLGFGSLRNGRIPLFLQFGVLAGEVGFAGLKSLLQAGDLSEGRIPLLLYFSVLAGEFGFFGLKFLLQAGDLGEGRIPLLLYFGVIAGEVGFAGLESLLQVGDLGESRVSLLLQLGNLLVGVAGIGGLERLSGLVSLLAHLVVPLDSTGASILVRLLALGDRLECGLLFLLQGVPLLRHLVILPGEVGTSGLESLVALSGLLERSVLLASHLGQLTLQPIHFTLAGGRGGLFTDLGGLKLGSEDLKLLSSQRLVTLCELG
ncbi:Putative protein of unknown function [Podospora comata]|uniref:Uncharacterized protein n=1 Tax=Podospora comata TaxID=48703 RepID=A0ABY6SBP0_PODCO|nr:Putative protein of unknown function [Podospora comata]